MSGPQSTLDKKADRSTAFNIESQCVVGVKHGGRVGDRHLAAAEQGEVIKYVAAVCNVTAVDAVVSRPPSCLQAPR